MIEIVVRLAVQILVGLHSVAAMGAAPCNCTEELAQDAVSCDTTALRNGAPLYYQYTCDSMWLTLQQAGGKRTIIYSEAEGDVFHLAYRLKYQLLHEYEQTLLFRYGCPANGPCEVAVIDKRNGQLLLKLSDSDLLNREATIPGGSPKGSHPDFLLSNSSDGESLILFYLNTGKNYCIPIQPLRLPSDPDYFLEKATRTVDRLELKYRYHNDDTLMRYVILRRYPE